MSTLFAWRPLMIAAALVGTVVLVAGWNSGAASQSVGPVAGQIVVPAQDAGVDSLDARAAAQRKTVDQFAVNYRFQFQDRLEQSGITFVHRIVDDAGPPYKAVHYDHGTGIAVADVDGDGLEDIYFVNQLGGNELWKNRGGGVFANITAFSGVALPGRISVTASFADIDNDGDQDLFVTTVRGGNALFENDGKGHFTDISKAAGVDYVGHSSGAVFFDYDNDGRLDLVVCNVGRYTSDATGRGGAYVGLQDAFDGHLHDDRSEPGILYRNAGDNRFVNVTAQAGFGSNVLVSNLAASGPLHWLKVALTGVASNRNGLGAAVRVSAGGRVMTQWQDGKSGYLSQSVLPLYFGLGDATKIDRVEVDWPSGRKQMVTTGLQDRSTLRLTEPSR